MWAAAAMVFPNIAFRRRGAAKPVELIVPSTRALARHHHAQHRADHARSEAVTVSTAVVNRPTPSTPSPTTFEAAARRCAFPSISSQVLPMVTSPACWLTLRLTPIATMVRNPTLRVRTDSPTERQRPGRHAQQSRMPFHSTGTVSHVSASRSVQAIDADVKRAKIVMIRSERHPRAA